MGYYYNYYIGYIKDGTVYPLGPYDSFGAIRSVISRSRNSASELHEYFYQIPDKYKISDQLQRDFVTDVKMLPLKDLFDSRYIKSGYFLIDDVSEYLKTDDSAELFYDRIDPSMYAEMMRNEITFGFDDSDDKRKSCSDYMYFAYPDYYSKEFESFVIRTAAAWLWDYKIEDYVVLMTEG